MKNIAQPVIAPARSPVGPLPVNSLGKGMNLISCLIVERSLRYTRVRNGVSNEVVQNLKGLSCHLDTDMDMDGYG